MCETKLKDNYFYITEQVDTTITSIKTHKEVPASQVKIVVFKRDNDRDVQIHFDKAILNHTIEYWKRHDFAANYFGVDIRTNDISQYNILDVIEFEPHKDVMSYLVILTAEQYEKIKDCEEVELRYITNRMDIGYIAIGFDEIMTVNCFEEQKQFIEDTLNNCLE